ncbi:MAG: hypothetical protein FWH40_08225 [Coriobacteriia bacterium]|nr:hypothetical protein [Coriobacteriia bacterium]
MSTLGLDSFIDQAPALSIITGHYGVGKTNLALNLVKRWLPKSPNLRLIDLDIVNPYFRSSDSIEWLTANSVGLLGPSLAGTTLDAPALAHGIDEALRQASTDYPVLVDVGGDPDGARALARYSASILTHDYLLVYVANFNRPEVATPQSALELMRAIEAQSKLQTKAIIGNTHLKQLTTVEQVSSTLPALLELSELSGLPLICVTISEELALGLEAAIGGQHSLQVLPMVQMVKTPWEE